MIKVRLWKACVVSMVIVAGSLSCQAQDLGSLATKVSQQITASGRKSVAVTDFTDLDGSPTELGRYVAEEFSDALFADARGFDVIDRTHLKAILQEHRLATTGLIDPATARKLGQIAGVETLVTGTTTPFQDYVRLSVKVLDTETAKILAASTYDLPRTKTISDLIAQKSMPSGTASGDVARDDTGKSAPTVSFGDFSLVMIGCQPQGAKILCQGHLMNQSNAAKRVSFQTSSHMVDESGNESKSDVQYSQYKMTIQVGSDRSQMFCCLDKEVEPGVPLNIWFSGLGLSPQTASVSIVLNTSDGTAVLRKVPMLSK